ncbi:MAG: hypothetical protein ACK53L_18175, partial [Pirellulaceae bacterium]
MGSLLQYYWALKTDLDSLLTRYTPVGQTTSVITPMPGSPLIDKSIDNGFTGNYATISSNLGIQQLGPATQVVMSISPDNFITNTSAYVDSAATQISLASVDGLPAAPFVLKL